MLSCRNLQRAEEDYCDPCLLVPPTPGFVQALSYQGRLFYFPSSSSTTTTTENTSKGYFRGHVARPILLCIASVAADRRVSRSDVSSNHKTSGLGGNLARSKQQAKRFLRFSFSHNPTPPVQPV